MKSITLKPALLGLIISSSVASVAAPVFPSPGNSRTSSHVTHVIEVKAKTAAERSRIVDLGFAIDELRSDAVYIFGKARDADTLRRAGFRATATPAKSEWFTIPQAVEAMAARFTSLTEVETQLQDLATRFPNIVEVQTLGRTNENRVTKMVRISGKSPAQAEAAKLPVIFYMGCHHAREHLSVEVPLRFAKHLVENYGRDADVTRLVDSREIYIAPIINPDGHAYDYTNGIRGRMWRKNRRRNNDGTYGVDLNRNYGYQWNTGGSSSTPSSDVYMGTAPFSEPESQNVRDFVNSQPRMTTLLSLHTFSELILYPWGWSNDSIGQNGRGNPADLPVFEKMARDMAQWNKYKPQQSSDLYIASGDTTDWAYGEHGIFAFTFELSPTSMWDGGFYPSPARIEPVFEANLKPLMYLLEFSDNPRRVLTQRAPSFLTSPAKRGVAAASFSDVQF